jgi:DNA-binding NarL/FixJ family response regulator
VSASSGRVRVLIADDQPVFAEALRLLLDRDPSVQVVGVAGTGEQAVALALSEDAEVVLMDIGLPVGDGFEASRKLLALKRAAKVIVVTGRRREEVAGQARAAGMVAYLSKDMIHEHVHEAIMRAQAGATDWERAS